MIRRLRDAFGGASAEAVDTAIGRGMADVRTALDNVIDDDVALGRIYAMLGTNVPSAAPGRDATAAGEARARTGVPETPTTATPATAPGIGPAVSRPVSRRKLALRSVAGVAAALSAGAVALATIGAPGAHHNVTERQAVNTAYVVQRVSSALSAADPGDIAHMTVTTPGAPIPGGATATTAAEEWSYGDQWRSITYSPGGHLVYDEGSTTTSLYTLVNYLTLTWARQPGLGHPAAPLSGHQGCQSVVAALPLLSQPGLPGSGFTVSSPLTVARDLQAAISCGNLTLAATQRVNGIEAIELTSRPGSLISETIWVSKATNLPVRVVIRPAPGNPARWLTADITWLPPTPQNLAKLTVPIPTGFRRVPLAKAVTPIMQPHASRTKA